ncbi:ileal sodium/bile acid cotransporter-like [Glandiceps talaboti]
MTDTTTQLMSTMSGNGTNGTTPTVIDPVTQRLTMASQVFLAMALILIMFGMGCTITPKEVWKNLRRPVGIIIGVCCQFILMPFLGWSLAHIFQLSPGLALGTLAIATSPGGTLSNVLTFWTEGDTCLSVCMTTCCTAIAIGMMPLNLFIYSRSWAEAAAVIPYVDIIIALVILLIPCGIGMIVHWKLPKRCNLIAKVCSSVALCLLVLGIVLVAISSPELFLLSWRPHLLSAVYPLLAILLGYLIPWLFRQTPPQRRAIAFETGMQNGALALAIINLMLARGVGDKEMTIVPSLYSFFVIIESVIIVALYNLYIKYNKPKVDKADDDTEKESEKYRI